MPDEVLLAFRRTADAIAAENALLAGGFGVKVMPMPGTIRAGCGICLRIPPDAWQRALAALANAFIPVEGVYLRQPDGYMPLPWDFSSALGIAPGDLAAIIGCGGKTTLMLRLALESRARQTIISTTTRILPPPKETLRPGISLLASPAENGKLCGPSPDQFMPLMADDILLLVEADGSRGLPLKGWADHEPVVPEGTTATIGVCTLWPIGTPYSSDNTHRPERFAALTGTTPGDTVTPEMVATMISHPDGIFAKAAGRRVLYINQIASDAALAMAHAVCALLPEAFLHTLDRIVCGSLHGYCHSILY